MKNHVMQPIYESGHSFDLVLANEISKIIGNLTVESVNTISDHKNVSIKVKLGRNPKMTKKIL